MAWSRSRLAPSTRVGQANVQRAVRKDRASAHIPQSMGNNKLIGVKHVNMHAS
jgi:hypothetical protein